jgi:DNA-binding response OmpR family regulator
MKKILLVEDDQNLAFIMKENLEDLDFEVLHITEGESVFHHLTTEPIDLVLMDVELSGELNGFEAAEQIRKEYPMLPIIFTTARNTGKDLERGFRIDNMDYVKKPFGIKEISFRIEALLGKNNAKEAFMVGSLTFNPILNQLQTKEGEIFHLTNLESRFLAELNENAGRIVSKEQLIETLWEDIDDPKSKEKSIHNLAYSLRQHLKGEPNVRLEMISKQGYRILLEAKTLSWARKKEADQII